MLEEGMKHPGKIKWKLAEMLCQKTGAYFSPYDFQQSHPSDMRYRGVCSWDITGRIPAKGELSSRSIHIYSWDTMTNLVKGFSLSRHYLDHTEDYEAIADNDP